MLAELSGSLGIATNNVAEYNGLIAALQWAVDHDVTAIAIKGDSLLIVEQMRGNYKVKNEGLKPLHMKARMLVMQIGDVSFEHVPREQEQGRRSPVERRHGRQPRLANGVVPRHHRPGLLLSLTNSGNATVTVLPRSRYGDGLAQGDCRRPLAPASPVAGLPPVPAAIGSPDPERTIAVNPPFELAMVQSTTAVNVTRSPPSASCQRPARPKAT